MSPKSGASLCTLTSVKDYGGRSSGIAVRSAERGDKNRAPDSARFVPRLSLEAPYSSGQMGSEGMAVKSPER